MEKTDSHQDDQAQPAEASPSEEVADSSADTSEVQKEDNTGDVTDSAAEMRTVGLSQDRAKKPTE